MDTALKKIARSDKYQFLYTRSKDYSFIRLFDNQSDFSRIQMRFLQWLEIYSSLYNDLYMKKPHLTEEVIKDDIRMEAYLFYKKKYGNTKTEKKSKDREIDTSGDLPIVNFKGK